MIFPSQRIHPREMVDSLVWLHLVKLVDLNKIVTPQDVPLVIRIVIFCLVGSPTQTHLKH